MTESIALVKQPSKQVTAVGGRTGPRLRRTTLTTSRLLDFCSRKELVAQTGHPVHEWPLVVLKELLDNALDGSEEAGVSPVIHVVVDQRGITVVDNGPGIPASTIEGILDYTLRVSNREAYVSPTRGAQGLGLKTLAPMPYVLDGKAGRVETAAQGVRHQIAFRVDHIRQEPVIDHQQVPDPDAKNGTRVTLEWPDSACSIVVGSRVRFLQIAADYSWLNPHLTLNVDRYGERTQMPATSPAWKKWLPCDPTCPHWYTPERFERLAKGYIAHDRERGEDRTVRAFVSEFRGLSSSAKQKAVLDTVGAARKNLSALANGNDWDHDLAHTLLLRMKQHSKAVKPARLGVIGEDHLRQRFESVGCDPGSFTYNRQLGVTEDLPWVVETAFGYVPAEVASRRLVTGVNWSPGIRNPFRQLGRFGESCDTVLESLRLSADDPVVLVLHLACPCVEYTDRGKAALALGGAV